MEKLTDGDYELSDGRAWVSVSGIALRIRTLDDGIVIDAYPDGEELGDPISKTVIFNQGVNHAA